MYNDKANQISKVVQNYLDGVYYGNVKLLQNSFTENAFLFGDIKGDAYKKSLEEYLEGVKARKSPEELEEPYKMEILGIEVVGNVGIAKVHLPMLGFNYYDFLSLCLVDGEWKIVNKVFTHVE